MKLLIVEDDARLAAVLRRGLCEAGHVVDLEHDGLAGEYAATSGGYDAILLDVNLPGKDGFAIAASIRARGDATPILILTSRDTSEDTIAGLDAGADDYLRKPFVFAELNARLRSITRRKGQPAGQVLCVEDLRFDHATRELWRGTTLVPLTARETAFIEFLMRNSGIALTQPMIEAALWEADRDTVSNLIRVYIGRLRAKLSPNGEPEIIHTIRGIGYRLGSA
jgi:DNA-binding response OmpR family regulator